MSCPDCFKGHIHEGAPQGKMTKLHGLNTYVSQPAEGKPVKGIVIIIPDAFGVEFVNNKLLADHLVEKGDYKVYLPDFMNGNAAPVWTVEAFGNLLRWGGVLNTILKPYHLATVLYSMVPFLILNRFGKSWPIVQSFFTAVRENEGASLPVGAAGYCWGGKHVVNLAHGTKAPNGKPLIDAGFTGHPSGLEIPAEIEKITKPVSFAIGDKDFGLSVAQIEEIKKVVESKTGEAKGEVRIYAGAGHGFCVRADRVHIENEEKQAAEAEDQLLDWFSQHFRTLSYEGA